MSNWWSTFFVMSVLYIAIKFQISMNEIYQSYTPQTQTCCSLIQFCLCKQFQSSRPTIRKRRALMGKNLFADSPELHAKFCISKKKAVPCSTNDYSLKSLQICAKTSVAQVGWLYFGKISRKKMYFGQLSDHFAMHQIWKVFSWNEALVYSLFKPYWISPTLHLHIDYKSIVYIYIGKVLYLSD